MTSYIKADLQNTAYRKLENNALKLSGPRVQCAIPCLDTMIGHYEILNVMSHEIISIGRNHFPKNFKSIYYDVPLKLWCSETLALILKWTS